MTNMKMWRMRDGTKIRIRDMDDRHLLNTLRLLDRAHSAQCWAADCFADTLNGDMAQFCAERDAAAMYEEGPSASWPIYDDLYEEAQRRGLNLRGIPA